VLSGCSDMASVSWRRRACHSPRGVRPGIVPDCLYTAREMVLGGVSASSARCSHWRARTYCRSSVDHPVPGFRVVLWPYKGMSGNYAWSHAARENGTLSDAS